MVQSLHRKRAMRAALLLLLMTAGVTKVFADETFTVGYYKYYILSEADRTVSIGYDVYNNTFPNNFMAELPRTVTYQNVTYTVTQISGAGFWYCPQLLAIKIPNTVTKIREYAFKGCENLQTVVIPNSVEDIEKCVFEDCPALQSAYWPENPDCWKIYNGTFRGCTGLLHYNFPENVTSIDTEAFKDCTGLQEVYLSSTLDHINANAFKNCSALIGVYSYNLYPPVIYGTTFTDAFAAGAKVYVPAESLYRYQTEYWEQSVNFAWPARSTNVSADMIEVMPAHKFLTYENFSVDHNILARVTGYRAGISGDLVIPSIVSSSYVTEIVPQALENCTSITSVIFPETMKTIGDHAFSGCTGLTIIDLSACNEMTTTGKRNFVDCDNVTTVLLPANLTTIGNHAFASCNALASIEIPGAVTCIEMGAFQNCTALTSVTFPQSVGIIEQQAFQGCTALASITALRTLPPRAYGNTFDGVTKTIPMNIPNGATANYNSVEGWSDFTNFVELPASTLLYSYDEVNHTATITGYIGEVSGVLDIPSVVTRNSVDYTVTAIGDNAFMGCSNLRGVTFPATLTSIGQYAFRECTGITSVVIPSTLTDLGDGAFLWCTSLAEVTLPDNLTRIGKGMFEGAAFTEIELPNSLQVIDKLAFYATGLTSVILPESVTAIGEMAFRDCLDLEYVVALPTTPPTINANSFEDVERIPLYMAEASYDAYHDAPLWSTIFNISQRPGLIYNTESTTATVAGCTPNYVGDLVVPATFGNKTVVGIEANALKDQQYITSVSIPATVTSIGEENFRNCPSLASIAVDASNTEYKAVNDVLFNEAGTLLLAYPAGKTATSYDMPYGVVSVSEDAFYKNNSLTTINLSADLNMENPYLFLRDIDNLTTITVDGGSTHYQAENGVLFNYGKTKLLYFPDGKDGNYTIPASASTIGAWSFYNCKNLNSVTINSTVSDIEANAFWGCKGLTAVIIPGNITTVKENTFNNSGLKSVTFLGNVTAIENGAFAGTALTSVMLPASVTNIGTAFAGCESLGEITCKATTVPTTALGAFWNVPTDIPVYVPAASVSAYQNATGWSQFTNIQAITDPNQYITYTYDDNNYTATVTGLSQQYSGALVIPGTVTHNNATYTVTAIADNAFKDNTGLTSVDIAHTVESIGEYAFSGCTGMTELTIGRNVKTIGDYAFYNCYNINAIHYYALNGQSVADNAWLVDAVDVATIPEKTLDIKNCVQTIPACCFYALYGLRDATVTIPNSVTSIGDWAFRYSDIKGINIGGNVTYIGKYAFDRTGLTSVVLPSNVTSVGARTFYNCSSLSSATVWGVENLAPGMFEGCTALTSFDVKSPVRTIGDYAFRGCTSLATLTTAGYGGNLTTIGEEAFRNCALTSVDIPASVTRIKDYAFRDNGSLTTVILGTGLDYIGHGVFWNCSNLATVTYNSTHCDYVGSGVWHGTGDQAKTLNLGSNVNYIPERAFHSLKGFTSVTLPNGVTEIGESAFVDCSLTSLNVPNSVTSIGYMAFMNNPIADLTLGSGLTFIDDYAFNGENEYLETVTSYNTMPPTIFENTFYNDPGYIDASLYVLGSAAEAAYSTAEYWELFLPNIQSMDGYYFTGATDSNWSTASNWSNGTVPTTEYEEVTAVIMADATVNITDAFVKSFTIMDGTTVTIASGKSLKIGDGGNGSFTSSGASALVVKDGGSIVNNLNQNIAATVEKNITGYGNSSGNWNFISSPIVGANTYEENYNYTLPNNVENLFANPANNYDLYAFDQSAAEAEWVNYKQHSEDFKLVDGNGYLYANHDNVTLSFAGDVRPSNSDYSMTPVFKQDVQIVYNNPDNPDEGYYEQTVDYPFTGWNLVGNPFTCKAYIKDDYSILSSGFYKMNPDGTSITSVEGFSEEIPAGTGVFVKVSDMYDPMSGNQYAFTTETPMRGFTNGSLQVVLKQALMRGDAVQVDNAIVSFNEGNPLEKLVLFRDDAHIAIPQNGKKYAIVCTEPCGEMPLNLDAVMGGRFTLEVAPKDVEMSYLHLIDNLTGTDVDLLKESNYSFESNISDYASRFKLVFVAGSAAAEMEDFAFFSNGNLVVANNGQATLQVIDINGRVLRSERINGSTNVSLKESAGVYVLRLVNGENVKNQKIIIK